MPRKIIAAAVPVLTTLALLVGSQPAAAGGGCFQPDTQGTGKTVAIKERCFTPTVLYIQPGATVIWRNDDTYQHLVVGSLASWSGGAATLDGGQTVARQFPNAGIYPYSCPLHYGMNGVIIVGDGKATTALTIVKPAASTPTGTTSPSAGAWPLLAVLAVLISGGLGWSLGQRRSR
jgi:plastocyanin